jgi:hypothetical protein
MCPVNLDAILANQSGMISRIGNDASHGLCPPLHCCYCLETI